MDVLRLIRDEAGSNTALALTGAAGEVLQLGTNVSTSADLPLFLILAEAAADAPRANCAVEGVLDGRPVFYWGTDEGLVRRVRAPDGSFFPVEAVPQIQGKIVCLGASDHGTCMGVRGVGGARIAEISPKGALVHAKKIVSTQATIRRHDGRAVEAFLALGGHQLSCAGPPGVGNCCEVLFAKVFEDTGTFSYGGTGDLQSFVPGALRIHDRPGEHVFFAAREGEIGDSAVEHSPSAPQLPSEVGQLGILAATDPVDGSHSGHEISFWNGKEWVAVGAVPWRVVCFLKLDDTHFAVGGRWTDGKMHEQPAFAVFAFPTPQT